MTPNSALTDTPPGRAPARRTRATAGPLEGGNASGRATRELLMLTAERLVAERGLGSVTMRDIGVAAGQRNNGVTQYHFGDLRSLILAIYEYRIDHLSERRLEILAEIREHGELDDPVQLFRALILPHAESIADPDNHFVGLLSQLMAGWGDLGGTVPYPAPERMVGYDALREALRDCFPELTPSTFDGRLTLAFNWAVQALAAYEVRARTGVPQPPLYRFLDEIVLMLVAGLGAEPRRSAATSSGPRRRNGAKRASRTRDGRQN
jgi:AcrR family transcriptional regulator